MNHGKPAIEPPEVGAPFWLDAPQIEPSFVVLAGIAALCFNGAWFWVWNIGESRRAAVVIGTAIGVLISLVWCGIRIQRFDLRTWQWRNATYRQPYGRTVGLIIGLASGAGALTARYIAQVTGQDVQLGLMAGIFICFGIFGIWSMIEGTWYLWYFRHRKRTKRQ